MTTATITRRATRSGTPIVKALRRLAHDFDDAADHYAGLTGEHNDLLRNEAMRAACQLRLVATFVVEGTYSERQGFDWVKAGWRIVTAIGRANLR